MNELEIIFVIAGILAVGMSVFILWRKSTRNARYGNKCEKKVRKELAGLKGSDYAVINDILIPSGASSEGRNVQIDHIVVSTRGIFVIETKGLRGHIVGKEHSQYWEQKFMMSSKSFYNPLLQNDSHIRSLRRHLRGVPAVLFVSVTTFTDAWRIDVAADDIVEHRSLLPDRHIRRTLDPSRRRKRHWWNRSGEVVLDESRIVLRLEDLKKEIKRRDKVIDRDNVRDLYEKILSLDIKGREARSKHKRFVKDTAKRGLSEIRSGRCPRCGSPLVVREGDYGPFYACSDFPDCLFVCSVNPE